MKTREEHVAEQTGKPFPVITLEGNDEAVALDVESGDIEGGEGSAIFSQEELGGSSKVLLPPEQEGEAEEHEEAQAQEGQQEASGQEEAQEEVPTNLHPWEIARLQRNFYAAERERDRLRELNRTNKGRIDNLETMVGEVRDHLRAQNETQPPEGMENDPYSNYWNERISRLEKSAETPDASGPTATEIADTRRFAASSAAGMRSQMPEGHFDEAYQFARRALAEESGLSGDQFNIYEQGLIWEMQQSGHDPAVEALRFAESKGWRPQNGVVAPAAPAPAATREPNPAVNQSRVRRMRRGVDQNVVAESASVHVGRSGTMSLDNFYARYDKAERNAIFAKNPDAFSELALNNEIATKHLPQE